MELRDGRAPIISAERKQAVGTLGEWTVWKRHGAVASVEEIPVELPDFYKIREQNFFVIVATIVYEEAICAELSSCGFKEANEYGRISTLADQIARTVLRLATKHWKQN